MIYLLDVNVLIALIDPQQNGTIRIAGHPRYPGAPATPALVAESLRVMRKLAGHVFWADDISLLDDEHVDAVGVRSSEVTDVYLLALAKARGGKLATFDRRIRAEAVEGGDDHLLHIPTSQPPKSAP